MSAILTTCPICKGQYMAGMVGAIAWPTHRCNNPRDTSGRRCGTCGTWVNLAQSHSCAGAPPR